MGFCLKKDHVTHKSSSLVEGRKLETHYPHQRSSQGLGNTGERGSGRPHFSQLLLMKGREYNVIEPVRAGFMIHSLRDLGSVV